MTWQQSVVDAWRYLEAHGKPSARKAIAIARMAGARFTDGDAYGVLSKFASAAAAPPQSRRSPAAKIKHERRSPAAVPPQSRRSFVRENKELLVTKTLTILSESLLAAEPLEEPVKNYVPKKRILPEIDDPKQAEWVIKLRKRVGEMFPMKLVALDIFQRLDLAKYHAWRWGNCTRDEVRNQKRAAEVAVGITGLACSKDFAGITVSEYILSAEDYWHQRGMLPWFKPWEVTSQFDPPKVLREKVLCPDSSAASKSYNTR
jgi:hypothetical protein